jgi:hypothetical protein
MTSTDSKRKDPHWAVLLVLGLAAGLLLTWLGLNDWRFPWVPGQTQSASQSTSPVVAEVLDGGAVDLSWTAVDDDRLDHYSIVVVAVSPISYSYGVPFFEGIAPTNERVYPESELNSNLEAEGRSERVTPGQKWHVCVTAMMAAPEGESVAPYTLADTQSCSDDFVVP